MRLLRGESCECVQLRLSEFERHPVSKTGSLVRRARRLERSRRRIPNTQRTGSTTPREGSWPGPDHRVDN